MKILLTTAVIMSFTSSAFADNDYLNLSFQDYEHYDNTTSQPSVGSADIDYVHLSFQDNDSLSYGRPESQTKVDGEEIDYVNQSFQDSY